MLDCNAQKAEQCRQVRYCVKFERPAGKLVLKVTDDVSVRVFDCRARVTVTDNAAVHQIQDTFCHHLEPFRGSQSPYGYGYGSAESTEKGRPDNSGSSRGRCEDGWARGCFGASDTGVYTECGWEEEEEGKEVIVSL